MTRSPAPVANHWLPGSTATERTQPRWPEMTRVSFQFAWCVGCTVRVVLWSCSACASLADDANVDATGAGVLSIARMRRDSAEVAAGAAALAGSV
jgi:hypothetical protein